MDKELLKLKIMISLCIMFVIGLVYIITNNINNIEKENRQLKEQNSCYKLLLNEDYIGIDCSKYFENDYWYLEYRKEIN